KGTRNLRSLPHPRPLSLLSQLETATSLFLSPKLTTLVPTVASIILSRLNTSSPPSTVLSSMHSGTSTGSQLSPNHLYLQTVITPVLRCRIWQPRFVRQSAVLDAVQPY